MPLIADAIRNWFMQCPALQKDNRFGLDNMSYNPTEYAVYITPSSLAYGVDITGEAYLKTEQEQGFIFASREKHPADVLQALANHGFYDEVISWIIQQNKIKNFPEIADGTVIAIMPSMTQYLFEAGANSGRYQISCKMKYRRTN